MKNAAAKSSKQIDKLIKQDWAHMRWTKDDKTNMQQAFSGFIKADKINKNKQTGCLARVKKYWVVQYQDRFARLYYYPCYSKINNTVFYCLVLDHLLVCCLFLLILELLLLCCLVLCLFWFLDL